MSSTAARRLDQNLTVLIVVVEEENPNEVAELSQTWRLRNAANSGAHQQIVYHVVLLGGSTIDIAFLIDGVNCIFYVVLIVWYTILKSGL